MAQNLYQWYQEQGKPLPPLEVRAAEYEQLGLGTASDYIARNKAGDPSANNSLLQKLSSGGMAGSMNASAPAPATPTKAPAPALPTAPTATATPTAPAQPPTPKGGPFDISTSTFGRALEEIRGKMGDNNDLMEQKRKLLQQLYDRPLTPEEQKTLSPSQQTAIMGGNRNLIETEIRMVNDALSGRKSTLDTSINYMTGLFKDEQTRIDSQRKDAEATIKSFLTTYGADAPAALKALYGEERVAALKELGLDIDSLATNMPKSIGEKYDTVTVDGKLYEVQKDASGRVISTRPLIGGGSGTGALSATASGSLGQLYDIAREQSSFIGSKFQQEQFMATVDRYVKNGDEKALANYLRLTAANNIPGAELKGKYLANVQILENLNALETILADLEARGVDTNIFSGSAQEIKNQVGLLGDPGLVDLAQQALNIRDLLARMRTGAAMTEQEIKLYKKLTPGIFSTAELNKQIIKNLRESLESSTDAYLGLSLPKGSLEIVTKAQGDSGKKPSLESFIK